MPQHRTTGKVKTSHTWDVIEKNQAGKIADITTFDRFWDASKFLDQRLEEMLAKDLDRHRAGAFPSEEDLVNLEALNRARLMIHASEKEVT